MCSKIAWGLTFAFATFAASYVVANDDVSGFNQSMDDKFVMQVGAYFADVESSYREVFGDARDASSIDLEDLGLDDKETLPFVYGRVRFSRRWRLELHGFGTDRDAKESANFDIDLGNARTIPFGAEVKTSFKTNVYAARVGYSFFRSQRAESGAALGLHVTNFEVSIKGNVNIGDQGVSFIRSEEADVTAPLPTIGLYGAYALTEKLMLDGRFAYFTLDYDKYDGQMVDAYVALEHRTFTHVGFGVGASYFDIDLDVDEGITEERYSVRFRGPLFYVKVGI